MILKYKREIFVYLSLQMICLLKKIIDFSDIGIVRVEAGQIDKLLYNVYNFYINIKVALNNVEKLRLILNIVF